MKLYESDKYFNNIREANKMILEAVVSDEEIEKSAIRDNLDRIGLGYLKHKITLAESEKEWVEKLLSDNELLEIYLDGEVRGIIIGIISTLLKMPFWGKDLVSSGKFLERVGMLEDSSLYLANFESVEDVRKDLFEKAGFEYISLDDLPINLLAAFKKNDLEEFNKSMADYEKQGVNSNSGLYEHKNYSFRKLVEMDKDKVKLLAYNNPSNKKIVK